MMQKKMMLSGIATGIAIVVFCAPALTASAADMRAHIARFILSVNPEFPDADRAANQLLYAESVGGADARLMAALVAQERRWRLKPNRPYDANNLCQITHSTARMIFGRRRAESWEMNLLWGSWYLRGCLRAEKGNVAEALRRYNAGPTKHGAGRYARAVLYYRRQMR